MEDRNFFLESGMIIDHDTLLKKFKCSPRGGMRKSLKTNSLVLISDQNNTLYKNVEQKEDGLWHFCGMGRVGPQSLDYLQNKTLYRSNETGIKVYLFEGLLKNTKTDKERYKFIGQVFLAKDPYSEDGHIDENGQDRSVIFFPLLEVGKREIINEFLNDYSNDFLVKRLILGFPNYELSLHSVSNLINLMEEREIDTLSGPGGWFLSKTGYFHNPNTKSKWKLGNYKKIIERHPNLDEKIIFQGQNNYLNPFYRSSITFVEGQNYYHDSEHEDKLGIRIKSLKYTISDKETEINFIHEQDKGNLNQPFFTLLIGPNGTGKSTVLSVFQEILLDLYYLAESKKPNSKSKEIKYEICYQLGQSEYLISKSNRAIKFYKGGQPISFNKRNLPSKLIASAFSINDRFSYQNPDEDVINRYEYLGIKSSNNEIRIGQTTKNLVQNIMKSSLKNDFLPNLINITKFINVDPTIRLTFNTINNKNIYDIVNESYITSLQNKFLNNQKKKINTINIIEYQEIADFINRIYLDSSNFILSDTSIIVDFDLTEHEKYDEFGDELNIILHLYEIGFFTLPSIMLKKEKYFTLEEASSGEAQYFSTMVNILSKIENNSVIIIDEPETSLHPNWQNKYIYGLKEIFSMYSSCHFIMATHSHFLISDLEPGTSSIISLTRNQDNTIVNLTLHDEDTFGWSVEDVLFNIFGLPTNRNYYVADEIDKILLSISLGGINEDTLLKINRFVEIYKKMKKNDPLRDVLELIFEKVGINV